MRDKTRIAIAAGDPAGIGPEVSLKAALDPAVRNACNPIVVGDAGVLERHAAACAIAAELRVIARAADADWSDHRVNVLGCSQPDLAALDFGTSSAASGRAALAFAGTAIELALAGEVDAVVHHVPKGVTPELAGLVTPMANGVEWSLFDGGVGYNSTVLIQGPGQQGLSQTVICKQAGAALIIVTGTSKDRARMAVAKELGADFTIDVEKEDPLARIMEITAGKGVDVALDCTAGAGTIPILLGVEALKRKGGTIVVQGEMKEFPNFPLEKVTVKFITIKSARGHSFKACELALAQLASKRFPLEKVTTHKFGLKDVDLAIRSVGGQGVPDVIHASLMPWE